MHVWHLCLVPLCRTTLFPVLVYWLDSLVWKLKNMTTSYWWYFVNRRMWTAQCGYVINLVLFPLVCSRCSSWQGYCRGWASRWASLQSWAKLEYIYRKGWKPDTLPERRLSYSPRKLHYGVATLHGWWFCWHIQKFAVSYTNVNLRHQMTNFFAKMLANREHWKSLHP